jgi:hypothetical protein
MCSSCNANNGKRPNSISEPMLFIADAMIVYQRIRWCFSQDRPVRMLRAIPSSGRSSAVVLLPRGIPASNAALATKENESMAKGTRGLMANRMLPSGGPANWATVVSEV